MNQENRSTIIGFFLILVILLGWQYFSAPSQAEIAMQKRITDSTAMAQKRIDSLKTVTDTTKIANAAPMVDTAMLAGKFGAFAAVANGTEETKVLENEVFKITFTNKGGRIKEVVLKKHQKLTEDDKHKDIASELKLMSDADNRFEYLLPNAVNNGTISTQDLYFTPTIAGNQITFRATAANGAFIEQQYKIGTGYGIDYDLVYNGLSSVVGSETKKIRLNWVNRLEKLEKNASYERNYSSIYYKETNESPTYCSCTSDEKTELSDKAVKWVSGANQFFNTALIAKSAFASATVETKMADEKASYLKTVSATLGLPLEANGTGAFAMQMYVGPNDNATLKAYNVGLEDVISYGNNILGVINRWFVRPIFDFLFGIVGSAGIAILLLTLLVKGILYPLSYRMLYSQAKMTALKPEIEKLKTKHKDDTQKIQMETMKIYNEYGVNPLGGCLPTFLQMPIWMALFRFFPATIDFRQQSFLWATDLSGIEVFLRLPFSIPFYGAHISLFALLWAVSLIVFTYYSTKDTDFSAQPAMKYVQYATPVLFLFAFNSYAAGLSLYMLFSNILNIAQTLITKNVIIDNDKIRAALDKNKAEPKKKSAFRQRLEDAVKQQQAMQEQKMKDNSKK